MNRTAKPGTAPGTIAVHPDAIRSKIRLFHYGVDHVDEKELFNLDEIRGYKEKPGIIWIDVVGMGNIDRVKTLRDLFELHPLALEDAVSNHQRAKVEEYDNHLYIVARMLATKAPIHPEQVSIFLGKDFVITFQERPGDCFDPVRKRIRNKAGRIRQSGSDYLAYALLDSIIDSYFPVVDDCGEKLEILDSAIAISNDPHQMKEIHDIRGDLTVLRRAISPLRDAVIKISPELHASVNQETQPFFRDCYDHITQLMDLLDTHRELCGDLRDYYMSSVSNRMNEVMKVLTIISTIFIPLSFIAGVYGMNFKNMPELQWQYGYYFAWFLMVLIAGGLIGFFRSQGWFHSFYKATEPNSLEQSNESTR